MRFDSCSMCYSYGIFHMCGWMGFPFPVAQALATAVLVQHVETLQAHTLYVVRGKTPRIPPRHHHAKELPSSALERRPVTSAPRVNASLSRGSPLFASAVADNTDEQDVPSGRPYVCSWARRKPKDDLWSFETSRSSNGRRNSSILSLLVFFLKIHRPTSLAFCETPGTRLILRVTVGAPPRGKEGLCS